MSEIISWVGSVNNLYTADSPDSWKGNWLQEMVKIIVKESKRKPKQMPWNKNFETKYTFFGHMRSGFCRNNEKVGREERQGKITR